MKFTTLLALSSVTLALIFSVQAAPTLDKRSMGWQTAPETEDTENNNPWDKRSMSWDSAPETEDAENTNPWDKRSMSWDSAPVDGPEAAKVYKKRSMGWQEHKETFRTPAGKY